MVEVEQIIDCVMAGEVESTAEWMDKHEQQAEGDLSLDRVDAGGSDQVCVAYTPGVTPEITVPDRDTDVDLMEIMENTLYTRSIAGVRVPLRTGCDRIWADKTDLPLFDSELPEAPGGTNVYYMASTVVCIPPGKWLQMQHNMGRLNYSHSDDLSEWMAARDDARTDEMRESIRNGTREWPRPFIEVDRHGEVVPYQEGRHRGMAAWREDVPLMDVYVFVNADSEDGVPFYKYPDPEPLPE